jgi:hypothetical protein
VQSAPGQGLQYFLRFPLSRKVEKGERAMA